MITTKYDSAIGDIITGLYTMKAYAKSDNPRELEVLESILKQVMEFDERMNYEGPISKFAYNEIKRVDAENKVSDLLLDF